MFDQAVGYYHLYYHHWRVITTIVLQRFFDPFRHIAPAP